MQNFLGLLSSYVVPFVWKIVAAIVIWVVGGWIVRSIGRLIGRSLVARKVDPTLGRYIEGGATVLLRVLIIIAIFGVLGIETTSFAALLAALGIAIGAALSGLLANFAAGIFMLVLRPFKVGDMISAGGITGDVKEIGLFVTTLNTVDNVRVYVGNNKIFSDSVYNYTTNAYRRVDLLAQVDHSVNPQDAIKLLRERVAAIPNVMSDPAPSVEILTFNERGTVLAVRPFCHNNDYWQVYFDTNKAIAEVGAAAGYAVPESHVAMRTRS